MFFFLYGFPTALEKLPTATCLFLFSSGMTPTQSPFSGTRLHRPPRRRCPVSEPPESTTYPFALTPSAPSPQLTPHPLSEPLVPFPQRRGVPQCRMTTLRQMPTGSALASPRFPESCLHSNRYFGPIFPPFLHRMYGLRVVSLDP